MLDFRMDEEQQMLTDAISRYAQERVRKVYRDAEEEGRLPEAVVAAGWELGLLPSSIPERYGGFGDYSAITGALAAEAFAWGDLAIALSVLAPNLVAIPVLLAGTEAQKESHLPLFCEMEMPHVAVGLTEGHVQYDPRRLQTTAVREENAFLLNGQKCYVIGADKAESFLIYANEEGRTQAYFVPSGTEGLVVGEREKLMGVHALPTFKLELKDVRVPLENRLGGDGGVDFGLILSHSRVALGALAVGVARASHEFAREYARNRVQFGEPIAHRQSIAFMLAEMAIDVDAARLMVWEAAWKLDQGQEATRDVTVMKTYVDEVVLSVADRAVQILGGYGYIREYPVELWLRNARGFVHFDGLAMI